MKLILALVGLFVMTSISTAAAPCVPGERDIEYNGRILTGAWVVCTQTEYVTSVQGYLPIGTVIEFDANGTMQAGRIDGYQWTQYPDQWPANLRRPFVYMLSYGTGSQYTSMTPEEMDGLRAEGG